jgi:hypothetical protein
MLGIDDVGAMLTELARERTVFHSEADFQHAFAWKINEHLPDAEIRLEVPCGRGPSGRGSRLIAASDGRRGSVTPPYNNCRRAGRR